METPSRSQRRRTNTNSPEFEFWSISCNKPQPLSTTADPLHYADELFSHGFLLPLHFLPHSRTQPDPVLSSTQPSALITSDASSSANPSLSASKRWRVIFRIMSGNNTNDYSHNSNSNNNSNNNNNSNSNNNNKVDNKRKGKCKKNSNGPASAELNINIWPFSRSRSAGNNSNRSSKPALSNRKVSSAPCSRSNSSRRSSWPSSPSRAGVHVGRASPVWQVKKTGQGNRTGKVNRQHLNCRSNESSAVKSSGRNGNLFGFRGLFSKKCNTTVLTV